MSPGPGARWANTLSPIPSTHRDIFKTGKPCRHTLTEDCYINNMVSMDFGIDFSFCWDKISSINNLKEELSILGHGFRAEFLNLGVTTPLTTL